ncbi:M24 family metallopeptidase [Lysobacter cavernae]|uniref:M24 family metallopeptidase n=1 Tax=Lysobacter cavernae TaxID=1685901 RepID=A0ABV7RMC7_9GAMM
MSHGIGGSTAETELAALGPWSRPAPPIRTEERAMRLARARSLMAELGADALIINAGANLRYFTGLSWAASERLVVMVLPRSGAPVLVCPEFELGSLQAGLGIEAGLRSWQEHENPYRLVADVLREHGARRVALDPQAPFFVVEGLRRAVDARVEGMLVEATHVTDGCRMRKSPAELALMQQAMDMTLEVHRRAAAILAPGITTTQVRRFIDNAHRALGADGGSTFCAVQFGEATAYPHGVPGEQQLAEGDVVLIDTGCQVGGYHSDITRTYVFGKASVIQADVWQLEREAQQAAFDAVRPGVPCEAIDAAARAVLERAGYGPDYQLPGLPHRTGHGIGLSIHEPAYLVRGDTTPLAPGMCFSDEPMIVVPGRFGIRLEDHFHVTEHGAAWFTAPARSLAAPFG